MYKDFQFRIDFSCKLCCRNEFSEVIVQFDAKFLNGDKADLSKVFTPNKVIVGCKTCQGTVQVRIPFWTPKTFVSDDGKVVVTLL